MDKILQTLSKYQIEALNKGIEFFIDLGYSPKSPRIDIKLEYTSNTDETNQCYIFDTSFSNNISQEKTKERLDNIKYFIDNIVVKKK